MATLERSTKPCRIVPVPSNPGLAANTAPELGVSENKLPPCAFKPVGFGKRNSDTLLTWFGGSPGDVRTDSVPSSPMMTSIASCGIETAGVQQVTVGVHDAAVAVQSKAPVSRVAEVTVGQQHAEETFRR